MKKVSFQIVVEDVDSDKDIVKEGEISEETINQTLQALDMALIKSDDMDLVCDHRDDGEDIPCSQMKRRNLYKSVESADDENVQEDAEMSGGSVAEEK